MQHRNRWWNLNNPYAYRDDNLQRLGFDSYRQYLKSDLWIGIRARAIERSGGLCEKCRKPKRGLQVHHRAYDPATLRGESINALTVACRKCHRRAEKPDVQRPRYDRLMDSSHWLTRHLRKGSAVSQ